MDWITNIKSFIAVVDANSFTKAAEKRFTFNFAPAIN
ncbi:MAG TPA: LysR family transcriptional regulator [Gammaproteobacteria bacterium]|nr:LysR family transcriptional regulator [Gammaproteobacteria bacterium]